MTGFDRPGRSFYLDDMGLTTGAIVVCKCDTGAGAFTPGKRYQVHPAGRLKDDRGNLIVPSARFTYDL